MHKGMRYKWLRYLATSGALVCLFPLWGERLRAQVSLVIGPGDQLHVQVLDTPDLGARARVNDEGELPLILGGKVNIAGLTPEGTARAIEKILLDGYLKHPQVLVGIEEYATQAVSVLGEVKAPGPHAIITPRSVLALLRLAGGRTDMADRKILIERHGTHEKVIYFVSNEPSVAIDASVRVYPGDTIIVPKAGIVYALGDV